MSPALSPPVSRALAVAILLALVMVVVTMVVQPLLGAYSEARDQVAQLQAALARAEPAGGRIAALRKELAHRREREGAAAGFLKSPNEALAAAELQDRIKSAVEKAQGELRSTQSLPAQDDGKFRRVSVRGQIAARTAGVQRVFYDLEAASPLLFLDNVEIRTATRGGAAADDPVLEVRFDLSGYLRRSP